MAKLVQRRRGTTAEHTIFTGAEGELTHDTDKETIVIHDGTTVGGFPLAREDLDNVNLLNRISVAELATSDGGAGQVLQTDGSGNLSFANFDVAGSSVGGDLTGTVSNAQIGVNKVGIAELDVTDGLNGQLLTTNGSGVLSLGTGTHAYGSANRIYLDPITDGGRMSVGANFGYTGDVLTVAGWTINSDEITCLSGSDIKKTVSILLSSFLFMPAN